MIQIDLLIDDQFTPIAEGMHDKAAQAVWRATISIEGRTKVNIEEVGAVDTGTLMNSPASEQGENDLEAYTGPTVEHGIHVELGTVHMPARPYLGPAVDTEEPLFMKDMEGLYEQ